jgi:hypothetical protein
MSYQVLYIAESRMPGDQSDVPNYEPESYVNEDLALENAFKAMERQRKHQYSVGYGGSFQIQGPDGFLMKHAAVVEKYRKWYWLKTGRLP